MATIQKRSGNWQVKIRRGGWPVQTRTFDVREDAEKWARALEREMDVGSFIQRDDSERVTFAQAAKRYEQEILPEKRGRVQDASRLRQLVRAFGPYSLIALTNIRIAEYRDQRLKQISPQSVVHELGVLTRVLKACVMDWGIMLPHGIPTAMVRKPKIRNERSRRLDPLEEQYLFEAIRNPGTQHPNPWTMALVVLALETAGRRSELLSLRWDEIDLNRRVARLRGADGGVTKNNEPWRDIPLSSRAVAMLKELPRSLDGRVLPMTPNAAQTSWERAVLRARQNYLHDILKQRLPAMGLDAESEIRALVFKKREPHAQTVKILTELNLRDKTLVDLHFHDLRHEATSRLADKLQMHELMKVTGHKTSKMLARYYHPRAEDLAAKIG